MDVSITVGNVGDEACVTKLGKDSCARHESETNHVVQVGAQLVPVLRGPVLMRPRVAERRYQPFEQSVVWECVIEADVGLALIANCLRATSTCD